MNKLLPWTIASVAILVAVCSFVYCQWALGKANEFQVKASALYADSLTTSRDSVRYINARLVEDSALDAQIQRDRDLAQAARPPMETRQAQDAAHFDRVGYLPALDSLDLGPVQR